MGIPIVLEGTFGWGWLSDELSDAGLEPHLASSAKVAGWRKARGIAEATREIRGQVKKDPAGERLRTIPGIAWIPALHASGRDRPDRSLRERQAPGFV